MRHHEHVLSFALEQPWAVTPPMLSIIAGIIARHVAGEKATEQEIAAALVDRKNLPQPQSGGAVAVLPIYGVLAPRMNMLSDFSGGTTYEGLSKQLAEVMANKAVKTIVLDINSPGGSVAGAREFAHEVMAARTKRSIVAQVQFQAGSAAYWIASAATTIVAAPSATVGSIGVYAAHDDLTEALAKLGVKRKIMSAGIGKADGAEGTSLSAEGEARIQSIIDQAYDRFVGDVVKGRGKGATAERVRTEWKASIYSATEALSLGMIDEIATLDETLSRLTSAPVADGRAALTPSTTEATPQEPSPATGQEPTSDVAWQNRAMRELLELGK